MNTTKRFVFGILSSVLLAVGLVRAADSLDPVNASLPPVDIEITDSTPDSSSVCDYSDER
jgi:hypothetical protein